MNDVKERIHPELSIDTMIKILKIFSTILFILNKILYFYFYIKLILYFNL